MEELNIQTPFDKQVQEAEKERLTRQAEEKQERILNSFRTGLMTLKDYNSLPVAVQKLYTKLWSRPTTNEEIAAQKRSRDAAKAKRKQAKQARKRARRS